MCASTTTTASVAVNEFIRTTRVNGTFEFFTFFFLNNTVMKLCLVDGCHVNVVDVSFLYGTTSIVQRLF